MSQSEVSRRFVVGAIGVGAATAAASVASGALAKPVIGRAAAKAPGERAQGREAAAPPQDEPVEALVAPLRPGDQLDRWTVEALHPLAGGAASVVLRDAAGQRFQLDLCARDESSSASGPGQTAHFEILLANHGDGQTSTVEDHGLAAMALAEVVRINEHRVERGGFATLAERKASNHARVHV